MEHSQHFIVLVYVVICVFGQCSMDPCQPLVNEGSSYIMTSSCPASENRVQFYWNMSSSYRHGGPRRLNFCNLHKERCYISNSNNFKVNYTLNSTTFTSSFEIKKVKATERNATLKCVIFDLASQEFVTLKTCTLKTYHAPETPTCHQTVNSDTNKSVVTCSTSKVYPEIVCKLFEGAESETEKEILVKMTYNKRSFLYHRKFVYNKASCSFELPSKDKSKKFFIKMFAVSEGNAIVGSEKNASIEWPTSDAKKLNALQQKSALYTYAKEWDNFNGTGQHVRLSLIDWLLMFVFVLQFST